MAIVTSFIFLSHCFCPDLHFHVAVIFVQIFKLHFLHIIVS